uniref:Uncharacterized protein n=2 Tax=Anguilla anguilla TaxID=7936 RepID=A0A0E9PJ69_ANGAN
MGTLVNECCVLDRACFCPCYGFTHTNISSTAFLEMLLDLYLKWSTSSL